VSTKRGPRRYLVEHFDDEITYGLEEHLNGKSLNFRLVSTMYLGLSKDKKQHRWLLVWEDLSG